MLIMISGAIGAGKDTLAELLIDSFDKYGYNADLVKFADPIRSVAFDMGFNPDDRATKEVPKLRVYNLSDLGTAVFKTFTLLPPFERQLVSVRLHQRLINIRKEKHEGIYRPVVSTREFMQQLGGIVRDFNVDYYIHHMVTNCPTNRINICSDSRFLNEQAIGDFAIYVVREDNPDAVHTLDSSEAAQRLLRQGAQLVVNNDSTLDNLAESADHIARTLINKGVCEDGVKNTSGTGIFML